MKTIQVWWYESQYPPTLCQSTWQYTWDTFEGIDHFIVIIDRSLTHSFGIVRFPLPGCSDWISMMSINSRKVKYTPSISNEPPAEDTFIRTSKTGCCFHTTMTFNPVEGMFVTSTTTS